MSDAFAFDSSIRCYNIHIYVDKKSISIITFRVFPLSETALFEMDYQTLVISVRRYNYLSVDRCSVIHKCKGKKFRLSIVN